MPKEEAFHSVNELTNLVDDRVHHNNSACVRGKDIPRNERRPGEGGYRLCDECANLNARGE